MTNGPNFKQDPIWLSVIKLFFAYPIALIRGTVGKR